MRLDFKDAPYEITFHNRVELAETGVCIPTKWSSTTRRQRAKSVSTSQAELGHSAAHYPLTNEKQVGDRLVFIKSFQRTCAEMYRLTVLNASRMLFSTFQERKPVATKLIDKIIPTM